MLILINRLKNKIAVKVQLIKTVQLKCCQPTPTETFYCHIKRKREIAFYFTPKIIAPKLFGLVFQTND